MNRYFTLFLILFCALFVGIKFLRQSVATTSPPEASSPTEDESTEQALDEEILSLAEDDLPRLDEAPKTGEEAWERYAAAQNRWRAAQHDLVIAADPELKQAAETNLRSQQLLLELQTLKIGHLLAHTPERVELGRGLTEFVDFPWTEQDSAELTEQNPRFRELAVQIDAIRQSPLQRAEIQRVREYLKEEPQLRDALRKASEQYRAACAEVEQLLEASTARFVATSIVPAIQVQKLLPGGEGSIVGLAVRSARGLTYCTDVKEGRAIVVDVGSKGPPVPIWSIQSDDERLEVAGIDGDKLLLVFNRDVPFHTAEQAWSPGHAYYELNLAFPGLGITPIQLSPEVCEAVAAKCRQPRRWGTAP